MKTTWMLWAAVLAAAGSVVLPSSGFSITELDRSRPRRVSRAMPELRQTFGQIALVDLKNGTLLLLEEDRFRDDVIRKTEYVITPRNTSVTDPLDRQFLGLEDLRANQLVRVEYEEASGRRLARSITINFPVEARPVAGRLIARSIVTGPPYAQGSVLGSMTGEIESVDLTTLTLVFRETRPGWKSTETITFVLNPLDTQVRDPQGERLLPLEGLRAGDRVRILFAQEPATGRTLAQEITVYGSTKE